MNKFLVKIIGLLLFFSSCINKNTEEDNKQKVDVAITLKINEMDYDNYFISDKTDLNRLKKELQEFRNHLDYKDTMYVDFREYNNHFVVILPDDFTIGQATFLASWINTGFCLSKHKSKPDKDLFFYIDERIIKNDFIAGEFRDNSVSFKVDMVFSAFKGINTTSYEFNGNLKLTKDFKEIIPSNFKVTDTRIIEDRFALKKFEGI